MFMLYRVICGQNTEKDNSDENDEYVFRGIVPEENLMRRDKAVKEIRQMMNHKHEKQTDCFEVAYFCQLENTFLKLMEDFESHEIGEFNVCNSGPHSGIDCFVANLEDLHRKMERYLWHDRQLCSSVCTDMNHTEVKPVKSMYPTLF